MSIVMGLMEIVKGIGTRVAVGVVVAFGLASSGSAKAETYNIDPNTWSVQEYNEFFDPEPGTDNHPYGTAIPVGGDVVDVSTGNLFAEPGTWFRIKASGSPGNPLTINHAGWGRTGGPQTNYQGSFTASSEPVIQILGNYLHLTDFSFMDGSPAVGVIITTPDNDREIHLERIWSLGMFDAHYSFDRKNQVSTPDEGIRFENVYMQSSVDGAARGILHGTGIHISPNGEIVTENTEPAAVVNCTADGLNYLIDGDARWEGGVVVQVIGEDLWSNNLVMGGAFSETYDNAQGGGRRRGIERAFPENTLETDRGAAGDSLYDLGLGTDLDGDGNPEFNLEVATSLDYVVDEFGRPLSGSPLLCDLTVLSDGRELCLKGYKGAIAPHVGVIPTMGAYGLISMAGLISIAGTLVFGRRFSHDECPLKNA